MEGQETGVEQDCVGQRRVWCLEFGRDKRLGAGGLQISLLDSWGQASTVCMNKSKEHGFLAFSNSKTSFSHSKLVPQKFFCLQKCYLHLPFFFFFLV